MRLPMFTLKDSEFVDFDKAVEMIRHAIDNGVNYIDSGFRYCNHESEYAVGRAIRDGYRDKVVLTSKATKFNMAAQGDLRRMLEHQLQKLDVDYLDFYCFHGIGWDNYHEIDEKTGWIKDMHRAKEEGLIKRIAFSFHDQSNAAWPECIGQADPTQPKSKCVAAEQAKQKNGHDQDSRNGPADAEWPEVENPGQTHAADMQSGIFGGAP